MNRSCRSPAVRLLLPLLVLVAVALAVRGASAECLTNDGRFGFFFFFFFFRRRVMGLSETYSKRMRRGEMPIHSGALVYRSPGIWQPVASVHGT